MSCVRKNYGSIYGTAKAARLLAVFALVFLQALALTASAFSAAPETEGSPQNVPMPDTWVFTDGLGRESLTNADVGDPREGRTLAMFYWTWHVSQGADSKPFNVQLFLDAEEAGGTDISQIINDYSYPGWPGKGYSNFWDEPVYGYYRTNDEWVLRRQAELLADAGVDAVFTDNTNGTHTFRDSYIPLMRTWSQAQTDGVRVPKISFMLPFSAGSDTLEQLKSLYSDIYRRGTYRSLWFELDGRPMLMAHADSLSASDPLQGEMLDFFTFRSNVAGYTDRQSFPGCWGWLSVYPQTVYYGTPLMRARRIPEQISVGVAQNHNYVTGKINAMNGPNCTDRTYTSSGYDTRENAVLLGANFEEQFNYALGIDPQVIFVTGWNEWIAGRYEEWNGVGNAFPDEFNAAASRDIEPSRGILKDHYYYQLVNFVRRYKGASPVPEPTGMKTIDVSAGTEQWNSVGPYYAGYTGDAFERRAVGYGGTVYSDRSARNDLTGARIARDGEYVYILCECAGDISPYTDPLWMNVYLDVSDSYGWNSFDYVINKTSPKDGVTAVLERFTGDGYGTEYSADAAYSVSGRYLQIAVKKSDLGISGNDFTLNLSVTDNVHDLADAGKISGGKTVYTTFSGDIMDFYTSGDAMPGGRFKFSYVSTEDNAAAGSLTEGNGAGTAEGCRSLCAAAAIASAVSAAPALITGRRPAVKKRKKE